MSTILVVHSPTNSHRWILRNGQHAQLGKSPWVDFSIQEDEQLRDFHLRLILDRDGVLTLSPMEDCEVRVIQDWSARSRGSEELHAQAAQTQLVFSRPRASQVVPALYGHSSDLSANESENDQIHSVPLPQAMEAIGMTSPAIDLASQSSSAMKAIQSLVQRDLIDDALRCLTVLLDPLSRLNWCYQLLDQVVDLPSPHDGMTLVQFWLKQPCESQRQKIAARVNWNRKQDPVTWLMASIGWTGGSLSGPTSIHVAPTDQLVATGVITALNLAGAKNNASEFQRQAIELGMSFLETNLVASSLKDQRHLSSSDGS